MKFSAPEQDIVIGEMILFFLTMLMTLLWSDFPSENTWQEGIPKERIDHKLLLSRVGTCWEAKYIEEQHLRHNKYQAHHYGLHHHHDLAKSHSTHPLFSALFLWTSQFFPAAFLRFVYLRTTTTKQISKCKTVELTSHCFLAFFGEFRYNLQGRNPMVIFFLWNE